MIRTVSAALMLACAAVGLNPAKAQDYPSRTIKLILPQPAGGAVDLIARSLGERLAEQMSQPVIVENMPGANGSLAGAAVARAAPDGYTLMLAVDSNLVINPSLYNNLNYDPFRDFVPISVIAKLNMVLVANPKVAATNVRELIAYAKANPNKLNYAGIGTGSAMHMGMELFKFETKTQINHVSYRGTAPAMTDVVAGVVDLMFTGPPSAKSMSEGGKLRLLAVASPQRMPSMPDVPTVSESGVPGYEMGSWFGLLAPARTPQPIVDRLSAEVSKAVHDPRFNGRMTAQGLQVVGGTPGQMLATMQADTRKWAELIKLADIKFQQ
ncbi:MAG: tripartite tricarboxylate transporter substrate binding protein [Xanthobacteraceae bacterium]|nr:tripartite tricarboxylate transporter substrate binding protein [Xanthobacteraceae bacterium]